MATTPFRMVLAPPGAGKTTFIQAHPELYLVDGDNVVREIIDKSSGEPLCSAANMHYYANRAGWGFAKWHRVNFRALMKAQKESSLGTIFNGFLVDTDVEKVKKGYETFFSERAEEQCRVLDNTCKLMACEVAVVLPEEKEYISRGQNRKGRRVPEKYALECMRCYEYLLESYPSMTRYQRFEDIPEGRFIPRPPVINAE